MALRDRHVAPIKMAPLSRDSPDRPANPQLVATNAAADLSCQAKCRDIIAPFAASDGWFRITRTHANDRYRVESPLAAS